MPNANAKPYMNPYLAGTLLGVVLFLAFFVTGTGLGASGGLNRMLVFFQNMAVPEHIDQVPYLLKMAGGNMNPLNSWIVYLTVGTVAGWLHFRPGRAACEDRNQQGSANRQQDPLDDGLPGRRADGLRRPPGSRLHLGAGTVRWRRAVGRQLGLHVRRVRRGLCALRTSCGATGTRREYHDCISLTPCQNSWASMART